MFKNAFWVNIVYEILFFFGNLQQIKEYYEIYKASQ